ncbi:hypothetical protein [Sphingobacterium deserti]|uniref:Uncharacterized protein n=1 Tax=Sphingobacterium deserti TaxID=1229276 RepID=A0A0B8T094_9SPHI|nr:hypothetical protein [Sphingobacterium deserti]KGE13621.1 hypothetical protein DI53_2682 [Sphingobacterium deserti]
MFEIDLYLKAVLTAFYQRRDRNELVELQRATRGKLMKEFLQRLENGQLDSELYDLNNIFGYTGDRDDLRKEIKKAGADKFRPLQDFIRQKTSSPADSVIKLLAIFIDFEPRPFEKWIEIKRAENEKIKVEEVKSDDQNDDTPSGGDITNITDNGGQKHIDVEKDPSLENTQITAAPGKGNGTVTVGGDQKDEEDLQAEERNKTVDKANVTADNGKKERPVQGGSSVAGEDIPKPKDPETGDINLLDKENRFTKKRKVAIGILSTVIVISLGGLIYPKKNCMCWNGEEFVAVYCHTKQQRYQVIGLDEDKLESFRKITQPDTLGLKDVGHVWYSKIDNEVEFFTQPGLHPIKVDRSLKIATEHIIENHAGPKKKGKTQISETLADVELQ